MLKGELSVGNIFNAPEEHIVFPVGDRGAMPNGSAKMLFNKWPGVLAKIKASGVAVQEQGKLFYPLECYFSDSAGWSKAPQILKTFLMEKLAVPRNINVGVIVPGSAEEERMEHADLSVIYLAVQEAAEYRHIVAYINR